jgi:hypothetical protein
MKNIKELADSWVNTDTAAIRQDVERLGSVAAAAQYSAEMSVGQPDWEALSTEDGRAALVSAISNIVTK